MTSIVLEEIICPACKCGEVLPVRKTGHNLNYDTDGAKSLGFQIIRIETSFGSYSPRVCQRCINRMTRRDQLRLCIHLHVIEVTKVDAIELSDRFACREFSRDVVNEEAWKLIESGVLTINDGAVTCLKQ